jgi:hypothetical protein
MIEQQERHIGRLHQGGAAARRVSDSVLDRVRGLH